MAWRTPDRVAGSAIARSGASAKPAAQRLNFFLEELDPGSARRLRRRLSGKRVSDVIYGENVTYGESD